MSESFDITKSPQSKNGSDGVAIIPQGLFRKKVWPAGMFMRAPVSSTAAIGDADNPRSSNVECNSSSGGGGDGDDGDDRYNDMIESLPSNDDSKTTISQGMSSPSLSPSSSSFTASWADISRDSSRLMDDFLPLDLEIGVSVASSTPIAAKNTPLEKQRQIMKQLPLKSVAQSVAKLPSLSSISTLSDGDKGKNNIIVKSLFPNTVKQTETDSDEIQQDFSFTKMASSLKLNSQVISTNDQMTGPTTLTVLEKNSAPFDPIIGALNSLQHEKLKLEQELSLTRDKLSKTTDELIRTKSLFDGLKSKCAQIGDKIHNIEMEKLVMRQSVDDYSTKIDVFNLIVNELKGDAQLVRRDIDSMRQLRIDFAQKIQLLDKELFTISRAKCYNKSLMKGRDCW
ncbi:hypothetical protein V1514DRAFT_123140 [Lipomyces japonicus]|uniref:uncharacterized protein n=1 Tax=Lipomyces japonicus TaxID=56871 RepID=UPI0034CD8E57